MKKILYISFSFIFILTFYAFTNTPVLQGLSSSYEFSISQGGSSSQIISVLEGEIDPLVKIYGESCSLDSDTSVAEIFERFSAKEVFSEQTEHGVSYYGYSNGIRYSENLGGRVVNIHVFKSSEVVKVGVPIIYGGY